MGKEMSDSCFLIITLSDTVSKTPTLRVTLILSYYVVNFKPVGREELH